MKSSVRNRAVAETAATLAEDGYTVLVSVDRIEQGERLEARIDGAVFLSGRDGTNRRQSVLRSFGDGSLDVLISTLVREGVNIPNINAVVLAEGGKSDIEKLQTVGRALRPENGDHAVVADVRDKGPYLREHFDARRQAFADYYGRHGPDSEPETNVGLVREWLANQNLPVEKLSVWEHPEYDSIQVEPSGRIDDFDRFVFVMQRTDAIGYDGSKECNFIQDPSELPGVGEPGGRS